MTMELATVRSESSDATRQLPAAHLTTVQVRLIVRFAGEHWTSY